jgi:uncharacterized protein (DUF433 family)
MRLSSENVWRGTHTHHGEPINRRRAFAWTKLATSHARECSDSSNHNASYPEQLFNVFGEATRRSPTISMDEDTMDGQPCISGTRIPVRSVLRALELYGSIERVVECYPQLNAQQVKDALYFSQVVLELPRGIDETSVAS